MVDTTKERTALVLCDLQPDLLGSLKQRENLLLSLRIPLEAARKNNWLVVYSGLQFKSGYEGVSPKHKLYGALCKLNQKLGDKAVHWFMEGWEGSKIISTDPIVSPKETDSIVWRSQHVPYELATLLKEKDISKVYVAGAKASGSVQAAVQIMMDYGMDVSAIKECIHDDNEERLNAVIDRLLPAYCNVISLNEMMENVGGLESYSTESKDILVHLLSKNAAITCIDATGVEHLSQPPQQQNQNTTATTNRPMHQQNHQGHAPWPQQCPPPGMPFPFPQPPPPFGMYPPPFGFGMYPPFVPQAQLLQPMQGQYNVTQPPPEYVRRPPQAQAPDAGKDELEKETKSDVTGKCDDMAKSTSDTSSTELLQLPLPALPPIDMAALGNTPLVVPPLPALPQVKDTSSLSDAQLFHEHLPPSSSKKRALESSQSPRSDPLPSSSSKKMTLDSSQILRML